MSYITSIYIVVIIQVAGNDIYPTITNGSDITCDTALKTDTCIIHCNQDTLSIPNVYCSNAGSCIINCTAFQCLSYAQINAEMVAHLVFTSSGQQCAFNANLYLPNNGNTTIIGDTKGKTSQVIQQLSIHSSESSASSTAHIYVQCIDLSNNDAITRECYGLSIDAKYALYLQIDINGAEYNGDAAQVICPINSSLSPSCVINAYNGASTTNLNIFTNQGIPQDLIFAADATGDYIGMTVSCSRGLSTIKKGNTFNGNCYCATCNETHTNTLYIEVKYTLNYDLQNMECFLYPIFVEWFELYEFINTFSVCSIDIMDNNNNINDTMVVTIITNNPSIYNVITQLSLNLMESQFKEEFITSFGIIMNVSVYVALQWTDNGSKWIQPFVIASSISLCCSGVCILLLCYCYCYRYQKRGKKSTYEGDEGAEIDTGKKKPKERETNTKTDDSIVSDTVLIGNGPVDIDTAQSLDFGRYNLKSIGVDQDLQPHGLEMMTQNAIFGQDPKLRQQLSQSTTMNQKDEHESESLLMGQCTYLDNKSDHLTSADESLLMGRATYLSNKEPWTNYNFNDGNNAYQQNTQRPTVDKAIKPHTLSKLQKKFTKKDNETVKESDSSLSSVDSSDDDEQSDHADVLGKMSHLLTFQNIECDDSEMNLVEKRPIGSGIIQD